MKCCHQCRSKPWPYLVVVFISTFIALISWMTMGVAGIESATNLWLSGGVFFVAGGILLSYISLCLSRYCDEDQHQH